MGFSEFEYGLKRKKTRREVFLDKMEELVPLGEFCAIIRPHYYVRGNGRPPIDLEKMVRMYLVSLWYNLSDEAAEDLVIENQAVRRYVGVDLSAENAPDRTTLAKFRGILEKNGLSERIFEALNRQYAANGVILHEGAIVDATIVAAPDAKKNKEKKPLDGEMSSTKKNGNYHFGFKLHIAADAESGMVTAAAVTTAKTADIEAADRLLTGDEKQVNGDAGYIGIDRRPEICAKFKDEEYPETMIYRNNHKKGMQILDKMRPDIKFEISRKRSEISKLTDGERERAIEEERRKAQVRSRVEHVFHIVKDIFGFRKTRLRGLNKNENKVFMLLCLANLYFVMQKMQK